MEGSLSPSLPCYAARFWCGEAVGNWRRHLRQLVPVVAHKLWMHPCNDASVLAHNRVTFKWVSIMETFHPIKDLLTNTSVCKQLLGVGIFFTQTFCNSVSIVLQRCLIWFGHQCFLQGVSVCSWITFLFNFRNCPFMEELKKKSVFLS